MTKTRQTQQDELYAAQAEAPTGAALTLDELQRLADGLRDTWWWEEWYASVVRIEVTAVRGSGPSRARYVPEHSAGLVQLAPDGQTVRTLCHEMAHVFAAARYGSTSHDPYYAKTYLETVYFVMGEEPWRALKAAFDRHGVVYDERMDDE